jgi:predicted RNA-binding protein YlqC (UPF0109 family)
VSLLESAWLWEETRGRASLFRSIPAQVAYPKASLQTAPYLLGRVEDRNTYRKSTCGILFANRQQTHLELAVMTDISATNAAETDSANADPRDIKVRDMLLAVMHSLVDQEDKLEMLHIAGADGVAFQVRASSGDVGKLIGKSGRTARAIRTILSASAAKNGRRYTLDIAQT